MDTHKTMTLTELAEAKRLHCETIDQRTRLIQERDALLRENSNLVKDKETLTCALEYTRSDFLRVTAERDMLQVYHDDYARSSAAMTDLLTTERDALKTAMLAMCEKWEAAR